MAGWDNIDTSEDILFETRFDLLHAQIRYSDKGLENPF